MVERERVGDGEPRPGLLKLVMKNQGNRKQILRNATKLRESTNNNIKSRVFINRDMTLKQQIEAKNLRDLLKERRTQEPEKKLKIHKGEIVEV